MDSTLLPNPKKPDELSILSWNIKMLPRFVLRVRIGPMRRARAIGAALAASDHDIIVFQEAFDARARRILKRALQASHPFRIGPANPTPMRLKTNSGIMIFSKIPLQELGSVDFSECEGVNCYARKGALLVAGSFNGVSFQVLGTHLDAGAPDAVYRSQYGELRALLDSHRQDGIPQIICGDFNTNPDRERFPEMMEIMDAENGPVLNEHAFPEGYFLNDLKRPEKRKDRRNDVDYIFYRGNGRVPQTIQRQVVVYRQDWAKDHCDLSDHYALMVRLRW